MKKKIASMFVLVSLILSISQIVVSTMFSTGGIDLSQMLTQADTLDKENMILQEQLYSVTAYTTVAQKAETLGFVPDKTRIDLSANPAIALKP